MMPTGGLTQPEWSPCKVSCTLKEPESCVSSVSDLQRGFHSTIWWSLLYRIQRLAKRRALGWDTFPSGPTWLLAKQVDLLSHICTGSAQRGNLLHEDLRFRVEKMHLMTRIEGCQFSPFYSETGRKPPRHKVICDFLQLRAHIWLGYWNLHRGIRYLHNHITLSLPDLGDFIFSTDFKRFVGKTRVDDESLALQDSSSVLWKKESVPLLFYQKSCVNPACEIHATFYRFVCLSLEFTTGSTCPWGSSAPPRDSCRRGRSPWSRGRRIT